ncbi:Uncharacterized protein APZ42_024954 [Daphnia magna]|uniref:Retrovirus-related Pol polyprotein from transposon TNT 1-94-like beta-barrel domain-containing protein n=1 Tax=Daphnia magna TaxID=35525 RepID=A0A164TLB3_9CRUS|nr:Uncharacterized protein APZ42_024954 [Daphnia magna]
MLYFFYIFSKIPAPIVIQPIDEQAENNPIIPQILAPANQLEIDAWHLKDVTCRNYILATNKPMQKQSLYGCLTAKEMWRKMQTQYVERADDLEHTYHQQLCDIKHDSGKDIRYHINRFCNVANKLREMGSPLPSNLLINKIICSLPESYKEFRARWRDVPIMEKTIDNMTMRLIGDEEIISCYQPTTSNNNVFNASDHKNQFHNDQKKPGHSGAGDQGLRGVKNGRVSDQRGHQSSRSYSGANTNNNTKIWKCIYCEVDTRNERLELANQHFRRKKSSSAYAASNAKDREEQDEYQEDKMDEGFAASQCFAVRSVFDWFADSGATASMTDQRQLLMDYETIKPGSWSVSRIGGTNLSVHGRGNVPIITEVKTRI